MYKIFLIFLAIIFCSMQNVSAQNLSFAYENNIAAGACFQKWSTANDQNISQFSIPVRYVWALSRQTTINVISGAAFSGFSGVSDNLNGFNDSKINASHILFGERMLINAGMNMPTGVRKLNSDQRTVAAALSPNVFNFRSPVMGQGLNFNLGAVYAAPLTKTFVLGGGVSYQYNGKFKPFADSDLEYRPGNEIILTLGADKTFGRSRDAFKLIADVSYSIYQADKLNGQEVFKSGKKWFVQLYSLFTVADMNMHIWIRNRTKGKNERGLGALQAESRNSNGNQFEAGIMSYIPLTSGFLIKGILDTRVYSKNEYQVNGARIFAAGSGFVYRLSDSFSLDTVFKLAFGNLINRDAKTGVTGIEAGAGINFML